ncbi:MAG: glutamine-hydrolyzing carbamoyl-phosphate synthase small subunit [Chloroflexi bacterium]|nr:glutamine-hydrolyzing carbamoyl-phosphate synthase small subunit [Chloroflexota bacterium]
MEGGGRPAMLVMEDGSIFEGRSLAAEGEWVGEVVFVTSMSGYQETITDPSYWGQMVVFTCPHIGNVGVNDEDGESRGPHVRAVLARRITHRPSSWRSQRSLLDVLRERGVPAVDMVDTRRLTLLLRQSGVMRGALSTLYLDASRLEQMARSAPDMSTLAPVEEVTLSERCEWDHAVPEGWRGRDRSTSAASGRRVVVIDCGVKENILRLLVGLGVAVTVVTAATTAEEVLALHPDGVLISNGPGDPEQAISTINTARALMGRVPLYGICLGHQIICLAAGGRTYKLPFGHHGSNHPVQDTRTGRVAITSQNHNYAIDPESLAGLPYSVTHLNLFDHTIEGIRHRTLPIASVQFHPESSPGPHDSLDLLDDFVSWLAPKGEDHASTD